MKTLGQHAVVARILGQGLVLATLSATVLSAPGIAWAQSKPVQTEPSAALGQAARQAPPATQPTPSAATGEPASKGNQEGIKVHGHWTIEVKDPDGKLVTHREFENSLQGTGQTVLADLLTNTYVEGGWAILLCATGGNTNCESQGTVAPAFNPTFILTLEQTGSYGASAGLCNASGISYCYPSLAAPVIAGRTVQLTGMIPSSPLSGTVSIDTVESALTVCGSTLSAPYSQSACFTNPTGDTGPMGNPLNSNLLFTGATLIPSVPVQPQQSVSVTVQFSFQ